MTTLTIVESAAHASTTVVYPGVALARLRGDLWRVTRPVGDVLGYVERFPTPTGERYRAKRLIARQGRFVVDGEFWSMADAIECLR
ncbi:hypothetical protein GCM10027052_11690 [Parafrigoribacterium mesophilum]|uniref:hypothetical protein n=1 Tax=Parafrigoribacterium mesophilum TaxID=433646 RepID=UPI0031FE1696